jgi:hypothetical protein
VETDHARVNMTRIMQDMIERSDVGEYLGMWMAHETDVPLRNGFPNGTSPSCRIWEFLPCLANWDLGSPCWDLGDLGIWCLEAFGGTWDLGSLGILKFGDLGLLGLRGLWI